MKVDLTHFHDAGHGFDVFGLDPRAVRRAATLCRPIHQHYFRVRSTGVEHVPRRGPAILVSNHAGTLPVDGAVLWMDVLEHTGRIVRPIADLFVAGFPLVNTLFARLGVVNGTRANVRRLLDAGELLAIFPEGVSGVAKPFRDRYHLQRWNVGHAELAIRHRVPIVPVAIIGSEESWPVAVRVPGIRVFGAPYLPIPISPVPLPVPYRLYYGVPIDLAADFSPGDADDPAAVRDAATRVHDALEDLVYEGLSLRREGAS